MGVRTQGQMGLADPPGKMDKKIKKWKHAKKSSLLCLCIFWEQSGQADVGNGAMLTRAESITENRNRYRDILKTETDTDVGIEKTEKPKTDEKIPKKTKIRFLLMTIY